MQKFLWIQCSFCRSANSVKVPKVEWW